MTQHAAHALRSERGPLGRTWGWVLALLAALLVGYAVLASGMGDEAAAERGADESAVAGRSAGSGGVDDRARRRQASSGTGQQAPPEIMTSADPARLVIPGLGLDVDVMDLGLAPDGTLEAPPGAFPAGWYDGSPTPGERGPAVLAGHVSWNGTAGVFADLADLAAGDEVRVERDDGSVATFAVTGAEVYAKDRFPTETVYGDIDGAGLRLITCDGLDAVTGDYEDNLVVYAELVGAA